MPSLPARGRPRLLLSAQACVCGSARHPFRRQTDSKKTSERKKPTTQVKSAEIKRRVSLLHWKWRHPAVTALANIASSSREVGFNSTFCLLQTQYSVALVYNSQVIGREELNFFSK